MGLIVGNLDEGAFRNVSLALARGFADAGLRVDVAYIKGDPVTYRRDLDERVRMVELRTGRSLFSTRAVARYLREQAPDVAVTIAWLQNVPGAIASRLARYRGRLVLTEHGHVSYEAAIEHGRNRLLRNMPRVIRRVYPWADALVAVDRGILDDLTERVGVDLSGVDTEVIPNPVDVDRVAAMGAEGEPVLDGDRPTVVTVGRLSPQKNQRLLIEAFARLDPGARLVIVGDGPERATLEALVARLRLDGAVTFTGHVSNPHAYTAAADVFVLPSKIEGCPLALIEALAVGCPSIATDCAPGPRAILAGGEFGVLVPPDDPAALVRALEDLLADEPRRTKLAELGRERARDFTAEKLIPRWLAFLER